MSTSFEDAVARARQIAAKIGGNLNTNGTDSGKKRSFDDNEGQPQAKKPATDDITQQLRNIADQQRASQATAMAAVAASQINAKLGIMGGATTKPLISTFQSTAAAHGLADPSEIARMLGFVINTTETTTVPDKMVGYLIGKGGEQITSIQAESKCVVQFVAETDGTSERKCILTGTPATIQKANDVLKRLISNFRAGGTSGASGDDGNQLEMFVPGTKVGLIIGKSGETIKGLMESTGTKIIVIQESNAATPHEKPVRITGDKINCMKAQQKILDLISDMNNPMGGGGGGGGGMAVNSYGTPMTSGDGKSHSEMPVQRTMVGLVIGKGGEMIKKISEESGSRVQFKGEDDGTTPTRILSMDGTEETNRIAMKMVTNLMDSAMKQNSLSGGGKGGYEQDWSANAGSQYNLTVPTEKCGIIIGKGGETIRDINRISGAFVELDRNVNPNPSERVFKVIGNGEQVMNAVRLVCEKAQLPNPMMDGFGGMGGGGGGGGYPGMNQPRPPFGPQGGMMNPMMGGGMMGGGNPMMGGMNQGWGGMYPGYNDHNKPGGGGGGGPPGHQPNYPGQPPNHQQQPQHPGGPGGPQPGGGGGNQPDVAAAWAAYYAQYYSQMGGAPGGASGYPGQPGPNGGAGGGPNPNAGPNGNGGGSSDGGNGGGRDNNGGHPQKPQQSQPQPAAASGNQPDYTAAWAEYYRSQGMHQHAAAIMQMQSPNPPQPPHPPSN